MTQKITTRTQVYRAIYYSGFEWTKYRNGENDSYTLKDKETSHIIHMEHSHDNDMGMDFIDVSTTDELTAKELDRFTRLCYKIKRRTKNLGIRQNLFEMAEQQEGNNEGNDRTNQ